ncbi:MAG TPA: HAD hydrolase family protein, partial [Anaerolineae bacterium]
EVLAIGDHDNDRSMIQWAGLGIAMGNAADVLKDVADFIVPSADEDGAAEAIDKFVLDAGRGLP